MTRHWLAALAAGLMLPTAVAAQMPRGAVEEGWGPKLRVTPYVGFSPGFKSQGTRAIYTGGVQPMLYSDAYQFDYASGPVTGLAGEYQVADRYSVIASIAWNNRGHTVVHEEDGDQRLDTGSQFWFAKLGGAIRFREGEPDMQMRRINASLFAAAALYREVPDVSIFSTSNFTSGANHYGANVGAEAELPFVNRKLAFTAALEDYMIFWSESALSRRFENETINAYGMDAITDISASRSNFWVLRVGLVFRFGQ